MADYDFLMGAQQPKFPDPLAQAAQAMTLAQLAGTHQLQQYTLQKAYRDDAATNAINAALPGLIQSGYSQQAIQDAMRQNPDAASGILAQVQKQQQADAETAYKRAQTTKDTAAAGKDDWQVKEGKIKLVAGDAFQRLANNPNPTPDDVHAVLNTARTAGLDMQSLNLPTEATPQAWQQWGRSFANMSVSAPDQIKFAGEAATRAETNRHNTTEEGLTGSRDTNTANYQRGELGIKQGELANSNMRARAAMVTADPFGMLGLNTGGGGGAPSGGGVPSGIPASDQAMGSQVAPLTPAQQAMQDRDNASNGTPVQKAMQGGLTGDAFLAALPGPIAQQVKAYAEGRMPIPTGAALRAPQTQAMMQLVSQYDPTFDGVNYGMRARTAQDFAPQGKSGQNITALNTAIGHAEGLQKGMQSLNNFTGLATPLNYVVNPVEAAFDDPRFKDVEMHANAVAGELAKVFRSTGMSEADINKWRSSIDANAGPKTQEQIIKSAMDLMNSRLQAIGDAYSRGMGKASDGISLLSPEARAAYMRLTGGAKPPAQTRPPGTQDAASTPAPTGDAVTIKGDDGYNALPSGALFVGPDGVTRRKP